MTRRHPRPSPSSKSASSHTMPSPPSSPISAPDHWTSSIDGSLEGSYLIVTGDEEDRASNTGSSTVGSVPDSFLNDLSSDSGGEEHRERWDTDDDEYADDDASHTEALIPSPSIPSGEWTDAEATVSDVTDSGPTVNRGSPLSDSHVQLIMPDPASSFLTSSDGTTPSHSVLNMRAVRPEVNRGRTIERKGVDQSWLDASSKLWNIAPEIQSFISEDGASFGKPEQVAGPYALLQSNDNLKAKLGGERKDAKVNSLPEHKVDEKDSLFEQRVRAVLAAAKTPAVKELAKKWSSRISMIALASVLSLALYQSFGPYARIERPSDTNAHDASIATNTPIISDGWTRSLWNPPSLPLEASTTVPLTPAEAATRIPDLNVIKHALSTFSTHSIKALVGEPVTTESTAKVDKANTERTEKSARSQKSPSSPSDPRCCALSVRKVDAVLVPPAPVSLISANKTWSKLLRESIKRSQHSATARLNTTAIAEPCLCSVSHQLRQEFKNRVNQTLTIVPHYAASAANVVLSIYRPALHELWKEYDELVGFVRAIAETSSTVSQFMIRRAARGVSVARHSLQMATRRLRQFVPPIHPGDFIDNDAVAHARAQIDHLSELVEDQAAVLADYVEEQSALMHDKGMESLRHAKRGLDKLIYEARKTVEGRDKAGRSPGPGPMPFTHMGGKTKRGSEGLHGNERSRRRTRRESKPTSPPPLPPPKEPSRGQRFLDMIHHGALAFVL